MDWMPQAIRDGIFTVLFISGPLVILAAAIGLVIGILQAATQVQEQTLGSAVKILGVFLALIVFGFYMFQYLKQYSSQTISRAFNLIPSLSSHPLPPKKLFQQEVKKDEANDSPLFSPEEIASDGPSAPQNAKALNESKVPEDEAEVVEVPAEADSDRLPAINYLQRSPSLLQEDIMETLIPEPSEPEINNQSTKPTTGPATQNQQPRPTTGPATQSQQPRPTTRPATQSQQPRPTTRPATQSQQPRPTTRPATQASTRPSIPAETTNEETPPLDINLGRRNSELEASRQKARAALDRIKSSINQTQGAE